MIVPHPVTPQRTMKHVIRELRSAVLTAVAATEPECAHDVQNRIADSVELPVRQVLLAAIRGLDNALLDGL